MAGIKKDKAKTEKSSVSDSEFNVIELPPQLDISSASTFFEQLKSTYLGKSINFNASKVERITTPGIQMLISAGLTAKSRGGVVMVSEPSDIFKLVISDLGFSNQLKEWMGSDV